MWATSITLMFWRLLSDEDRKVRDLERADEGGHASSEGGATCRDKSNGTDGTIPLRRTEEDREFPPPKMLGRGRRRWWRIGGGGSAHKKVGSSGPGSHMHEIAISMGITGDYSGRGWTCSIICELFSEEEMTGHVREAARVMQMFIHQQYSGRSLVFLMLLGHICNQLAQECSRFVEELKDIVPSRVSIRRIKSPLFCS